jgi:iron complex transport system substrate-binding protein
VRLVLLFFLLPLSIAQASSPQRVVSMSLCSDQMVLTLLAPERIAAVSYLARDPIYSRYAKHAEKIATHTANIEFIMSLQPDLVVASRYERSQTTSMLRRLGLNVLIFDEPQSIGEISPYTLAIAKALGSEMLAQQQLNAMEKRWRELALATQVLPRSLAVSMSANGYQQGRSSIFNELLHRAGWRTLADKINLSFDQSVSIERVIAAQPQVLLYHDTVVGHSQAEQWLQHPAWSAVSSVFESHRLNSADWLCFGPWTAEVVGELVKQRK